MKAYIHTQIKRLALITGLTALGLAYAVSGSAAVTFINSCPFPITQPGEYHLSQDLSCSSAGISITASQVTLHFDGHTMTGSGVTVGVLSSADNVRIIGSGTITGFITGIRLNSSNNSSVINMTTNNNIVFGVQVIDSANDTLISNTANGNGSGIIFTACTTSACTNNVVRANQTDGNSSRGISIGFNVTDTLIQANKASNNSIDLFDANLNCDSNTWKSNKFSTSNQPCIH